MKLLLEWGINSARYGLNKIHILNFFVLGLLSSISEVIGLSIFVPIFQFVGKGEVVVMEGADKFLSYMLAAYEKINVIPTLEVLLITAFSLFVVSKTIIYITRVYHISIYNDLLMIVRERIFSDYMDTKIEYKDEVTVGGVVNAITTETRSVINGVILPIKFMISVVSVAVSLVVLLLISYQMTILTGILVVLVFLIPLRWVNAISEVSVIVSRKNAELSSFVVNRLNSSKLLKFSSTEDLEYGRLKDVVKGHKKFLKIIQVLKAKADYVLEPVLLGTSLLLVYLGSNYYLLEIEFIVLFLLILIRTVPLVKEVMSQLQAMNRMIGPTQLVGNLLDDMAKNKEVDTGEQELTDFSNQISVQSVSYTFPTKDKKALDDVSFTVNKGELVAIVGPSGSGKSTLVDIITRMRVPSNGKVEVDNEPIQNYSLSSIRNVISYAPQEPFFFSTTVKDHINYGKRNIDQKDTVDSARLAGAEQFINKLENQYDTYIGTDNIQLSGGQKKRLDLARAVNGNAPILILDEPSSNLDPESSSSLYQTLVEIHKNTEITVIVITHDLRFISLFDKIVVINEGRLEAAGTHDELIQQSGWYKSVYKTYDRFIN